MMLDSLQTVERLFVPTKSLWGIIAVSYNQEYTDSQIITDNLQNSDILIRKLHVDCQIVWRLVGQIFTPVWETFMKNN